MHYGRGEQMEAIAIARRERTEHSLWQMMIHFFFCILSIVTVIPLVLVISISLTLSLIHI